MPGSGAKLSKFSILVERRSDGPIPIFGFFGKSVQSSPVVGRRIPSTAPRRGYRDPYGFVGHSLLSWGDIVTPCTMSAGMGGIAGWSPCSIVTPDTWSSRMNVANRRIHSLSLKTVMGGVNRSPLRPTSPPNVDPYVGSQLEVRPAAIRTLRLRWRKPPPFSRQLLS